MRLLISTQAHNESIVSLFKRKGSPCQENGVSRGGKRMRYSGPNLPEDIWYRIHSLMTLRDAARVACVSCIFLRSWRCRPNLVFSKETLGLNGLNGNTCRKDFIGKVDHILKNHSGVGVKTFELQFYHLKACDLDRWLQIALTAGIEELALSVRPYYGADYNFPSSLLFDGSGNTIRYLYLSNCYFHPTTGFGCLRRLHLLIVHITGDELECLLSNSFALEQLILMHCNEIICLKIPCLLQHLSYLHVSNCTNLQVIENKAPNLCSFHFYGARKQPSFRGFLHVKNMRLSHTVHYACVKLPSIAPNLETLSVSSVREKSVTSFVPVKFLHLKHLSICLDAESGAFSPTYDYFSLVYFLDACPVLETFNVHVSQSRVKHDSIIGDPSQLRLMREYRHANLKNVKIFGFCSAKSMVELAYHILENSTSLEYLMLDTIYDPNFICFNIDRNAAHKIGKCHRIGRHMIIEAQRALMAIRTHIIGKVPSTVKLSVLEPCSQCHD